MELLEIPREQDYFSERGIRELTGFGPHKWPLVVTKELIDNALDALDEVSGAKTVKVTASDAGLSVSDSGPGIEQDTLKLVYDFTKYTSSKFFHTLSGGSLVMGSKL